MVRSSSAYVMLMLCLCRRANASEISISISFIRYLDCSCGKLVLRYFVNTAPAYALMLMFGVLTCFLILLILVRMR